MTATVGRAGKHAFGALCFSGSGGFPDSEGPYHCQPRAALAPAVQSCRLVFDYRAWYRALHALAPTLNYNQASPKPCMHSCSTGLFQIMLCTHLLTQTQEVTEVQSQQTLLTWPPTARTCKARHPPISLEAPIHIAGKHNPTHPYRKQPASRVVPATYLNATLCHLEAATFN